jgi:hypothetical protein
MRNFPSCALVRSFVLNSLEHGPVRVADLVRRAKAEFGFSYAEIEAAAKHFAIVTRVSRGGIYWERPSNLSAIWWGLTLDEHSWSNKHARYKGSLAGALSFETYRSLTFPRHGGRPNESQR